MNVNPDAVAIPMTELAKEKSWFHQPSATGLHLMDFGFPGASLEPIRTPASGNASPPAQPVLLKAAKNDASGSCYGRVVTRIGYAFLLGKAPGTPCWQ